MQVNLKIDENTILHYVEDSNSTYGDNGEEVVTAYQLSFSFYDCGYDVGVSRKDIEKDDSFSLALDGDTKLFDSFNSLCQGDLWETIKEQCNKYDIWYKTH